jgi:NitT/TauT family transport system substrate-binding protein
MSSGNHLVRPTGNIEVHTPYHWGRRDFVKGVAALAGAAGLSGYMRSAAAEPPPEITRVRLLHSPAICVAPEYLAEDLLRLEGFSSVEFVETKDNNNIQYVLAQDIDVATQDAPSMVAHLDAGDAVVVLSGLHAGCWELFASKDIRAIRELRGSPIAVSRIGDFDYRFLSSVLAYVGLDPRKDIEWIEGGNSAEAMRLFAEGKAKAFFGFPPYPQELRAKQIGHVILNTTLDRPWPQYFCCMVAMRRDFVERYPAATKRVLRAYLKAADLCASDPERAARFLVVKGYEPRYEVALEVLKSLPYRRWRDTPPEDTLRFHALRLHEVGIIKSTPQKLIARGTDWRFLNELKRELKA